MVYRVAVGKSFLSNPFTSLERLRERTFLGIQPTEKIPKKSEDDIHLLCSPWNQNLTAIPHSTQPITGAEPFWNK